MDYLRMFGKAYLTSWFKWKYSKQNRDINVFVLMLYDSLLCVIWTFIWKLYLKRLRQPFSKKVRLTTEGETGNNIQTMLIYKGVVYIGVDHKIPYIN